MKKKALTMILAAALCVSLTACGQSKDSKSEEAKSSESTAEATENSEDEASDDADSESSEADTAEDTTVSDAELTIGALTLFTASNLDPAAEWNGWFDSMFGIGETLFKLDETMTPQPYLAASCDYDDDKTWTITLRDDVNYTNGEKMTGETVKASLERTLEVCDRAAGQLHITDIEADGQDVILTTDQPMPALLNELCDPICVIEYVADGIDYENAPVLTGPFIAQEFSVYDVLVVTRNEDYWGGDVQLSKVTFKTYSDGDALTMAMQKGEVDAAYDLPESANLLFQSDDFTINSTPGPRGQAIFFNENSKAVEDIQLRIAIDMAIDRDGFIEMLKGNAVANYGMFPETMTCGGTDKLDIVVTPENSGREAAEKVLAEAGYKDTDNDGYLEKDGEKVSLVMAVGQSDRESLFAQALQSNLKQLGIEMKIETYETTNTVYADGNFDIGFGNMHMAPTGNPQYFFDLWFVSGSSYNQGFYSNPDVDEMINKLSTTAGQEERDALAFQIEQQILDDMYYVVFANLNFDSVSKSTVTGLDMNPSEYYIVDMNTAIAE